MYQKIGIMGALPQEIQLLESHLTEIKKEEYAGVIYICGFFREQTIVLCCAGMGKANAASTAQVLITKFEIDTLIFNGIAGNLNTKLHVGDIVLGETLCYHDAQDDMLSQSSPFCSIYKSDKKLVSLLSKTCNSMNIHYIVGKIATGDQFIDNPVIKKSIIEKTNADCVEMEGAAVGQIALRNNIPFIVLRSISDNAETNIQDIRQDETFDLEKYANVATSITIHFLENL